MYEPNVEELLRRLAPGNVVLDVGGWACPFNRAQWIIDSEPYASRGFYRTFGGPASQGGDREWFTERTWVRRDICERTPWPFADKQFDFAVCSHTLEDVRDPLWVCSELIRVAKRGYIEVPSRAFESCRGVERPRQAGLSHHRWLVEIDGRTISFLHKPHMLSADWRFALPARYRRRLTPRSSVQWLWWEDGFDFREISIYGLAAQEAELAAFVAAVHPRSRWLLALDGLYRRACSLPRRAIDRLRRGARRRGARAAP